MMKKVIFVVFALCCVLCFMGSASANMFDPVSYKFNE